MPAINTFGVTAAGVAARIGFMTIGATSTPTSTVVGDLINEYAGDLTLILDQLGFDVASLTVSSNPALFSACRGKVSIRVAGEVHKINQRGSTELFEQSVIEWAGFLNGLKTNPGQFLNTDHSATFRSHNTTGGVAVYSPTWTKGQDL